MQTSIRIRTPQAVVLAGIAVATLFLGACAPEGVASEPASRFGADSTLWRRMLEAEDARGTAAEGIGPLIEGSKSANAAIRAIAVRGLGRLEQPALADSIQPLLTDSEPAVRAAAATALAQAVRAADAAPARSTLTARLGAETDAEVRGAIAESLGRLPYADAASLAATASVLAARATSADPAERLGLARAFYFLARQRVARTALPAEAVSALRSLGTVVASDAPETSRRIRTLAASALVSAGTATPADIDRILSDPDPMVRREIVAAVAIGSAPAPARDQAARALADASGMVRYEGVRAYDRVRDPARPCQRTLDAAADSNAHVALLGLDLLGTTACGGPAAAAILDSVTGTLAAATAVTGWHRAAHALVALARVNPSLATARLPAFVAAPNPFVRAWAARAATVMGDRRVLLGLTNDADANVRTEAVNGLAVTAGHEADSVYIGQLRDQNDSQLLQSAAAALEGSAHPDAVPALLGALDRITLARRETWRDSRMALMTRIAELGSATRADRLRPYLQDYDARVAEAAARQITVWTSAPAAAQPRPLPRLDLPTAAEVEMMAGAIVEFEMEKGGAIRIELLPLDAPTNAWRFARLVREGAFNGLTVHRIAPNFVVQGGSPGANEYTGDGPYTRDELGDVWNWRGTVGLSTRGRDTGDAQFYINLIDNIRLDHDYTIYGRVLSGMDVVDGLLEGDVIRRATLTPPGR